MKTGMTLISDFSLVASFLPYGFNISDTIINTMLICFFQQSFIQPGCSSTTCQARAKHHRPPATNKTGEVPSNREFSQSQTEMEATGQGNQERERC